MTSQPDRRILELLGIEVPILQAPMAGAQLHGLAVAVANAGGLGSLPCALLSPEQIRQETGLFRQLAPGRPLNLNFFCHSPAAPIRRASRPGGSGCAPTASSSASIRTGQCRPPFAIPSTRRPASWSRN